MGGIIYYDFTSAEAFALNEIAGAVAAAQAWQWRGVQVDSTLPAPMKRLDRRAQGRVEADLAEVLRAWPGGTMRVPPGLPNTRVALQAVAAVDRMHAARADAFRTALFRAYWQGGRDLSELTVVREVAATAGVPPWVDFENQAAQAAQVGWELEWKAERLGGVPRVIRSDGQILWGFRGEAESRAFLTGGT